MTLFICLFAKRFFFEAVFFHAMHFVIGLERHDKDFYVSSGVGVFLEVFLPVLIKARAMRYLWSRKGRDVFYDRVGS